MGGQNNFAGNAISYVILSQAQFGQNTPGDRTGAGDPKETWSLGITWLIYSIYLHGRILKNWTVNALRLWQ